MSAGYNSSAISMMGVQKTSHKKFAHTKCTYMYSTVPVVLDMFQDASKTSSVNCTYQQNFKPIEKPLAASKQAYTCVIVKDVLLSK